MINVRIICGDRELNTTVMPGTRLSDLPVFRSLPVDFSCGGLGRCGKCTALINGKSQRICQYIINSDTSVELPDGGIISLTSKSGENTESGKYTLALDIGTTTLVLALFSKNNKRIIEQIIEENPQRVYGADVLSRISYCTENGTGELNRILIEKINSMIKKILSDNSIKRVKETFIAGNTTMLHILRSLDCSSLGVYPFKPKSLDGLDTDACNTGIDGTDRIIILPCISAFAGADLVADICATGLPDGDDYYLIADLGTNAETALCSRSRILCTSAAAGPCFEGAHILCGMGARNGAICSYYHDGSFDVIGKTPPAGICGTGLIDIICVLLKKGIIDRTGVLKDGEFRITENIKLVQEDVRQYQLAKAAVRSAIESLVSVAGIDYSRIKKFYVSGGFAGKININSCAATGLIPRELVNAFTPLGEGCITGLMNSGKAGFYAEKSEYIELSTRNDFCDSFTKNINF